MIEEHLRDIERTKLKKLAEARGVSFNEDFLAKMLNNLVKIVPNSVSAAHLLPKDVQVRIVDISRSGDFVVITLDDGMKLKTFPSRQQYRNYYYCFRDLLPSHFSPESYQGCRDVDFRYLRGQQRIEEMIQDRFLQPTDTTSIIECGAYNGWKALGFSKYVGEKGNLLVLEIDPTQYEVALENVSNNMARDNWRVINTGVWDKVEVREYTYEHLASHSLLTPDEHSHHTQSNRITTNTLDNIIDESDVDVFDFINVQTGGSELESVRGLVRNADRVKVLWLGTHYLREGTSIRYESIIHLLNEGYRIYHGQSGLPKIEIKSISNVDPKKTGGFYAVTPRFSKEIVPTTRD